MAYLVDEKKLDRLIAACDKLGEDNILNATHVGSVAVVEFVKALAAVRDDLPKKELNTDAH